MKKSPLLIICFVVVVAISMMTPAYSSGDEDSKLALYGQYGGPFSLVDHHGKTVTDRDFLGQYVLMFFGYTYCPDVCPTAMQTISDALDILGDRPDIVPVFVSVDTKRDTPEVLKSYLENFHPSIVGMTGTPEQVVAAAKAYGVYYAIVEGSSGDPDDYLMNHSSITYLMGPDGAFITHFSHGTPPDQMAEKLDRMAK